MKAFALVLSLLASVAAGAALWYQHQSAVSLQRELLAVRADVARLASAPANTAPQASTAASAIVKPASESLASEDRVALQKMREELTAVKKETSALTKMAQAAQARAAEAAIPTNLKPAAELKNSGMATPGAAVETIFWAALSGDVSAIADAITLTPTAREKADALFARLPEETRAQYGSAEKLIALMIAKDAGSLSGLQVLGQRELSADDVGVRLRFGNDQGKTKDQTFLMRRVGENWKVLIPDDPIDNWARQLRGGK